ncbi:MAG TPA: TatD family hydrolase [Paenibacillaceae bacterium]
MLFDTHAHLDSRKFAHDREDVIARAREAGVTRIVNVGFDRETIPTTLELAERYDFIWAAVGWHPVDAVDFRPDEDLPWIESLLGHPRVVAVGEVGLDYHWDKSPKETQFAVLREMIRLAKRARKPLVIHNRNAHEDIVRILREEGASEVGGVMHCFSGGWDYAKACLDMNFYLGFGGPVTFHNAGELREVLAKAPEDRLLVETDSPYLAPHPHRGKRNEPAMVRLVAEKAAEIRGMDLAAFAALTTRNGLACFGLNERMRP